MTISITAASHFVVSLLSNQLKEIDMCKFIESVETEIISLEVYECVCGFHIGVDATYLEQVDGVKIKCPSFGEKIIVEIND